MIKFEGKINGQTKKVMSKQLVKGGFVIAPLVSLTMIVVFGLFMGFIFSHELTILLFCVIVPAPFCLIFPLLLCLSSKEFVIGTLEIEDDYIAIEYKEGKYTEKKIDDLKKIIDCDGVYIFKFYFPESRHLCVVQKDLIVEGTIEQFEEMFKDKIARKKINKKQVKM